MNFQLRNKGSLLPRNHYSAHFWQPGDLSSENRQEAIFKAQEQPPGLNSTAGESRSEKSQGLAAQHLGRQSLRIQRGSHRAWEKLGITLSPGSVKCPQGNVNKAGQAPVSGRSLTILLWF